MKLLNVLFFSMFLSLLGNNIFGMKNNKKIEKIMRTCDQCEYSHETPFFLLVHLIISGHCITLKEALEKMKTFYTPNKKIKRICLCKKECIGDVELLQHLLGSHHKPRKNNNDKVQVQSHEKKSFNKRKRNNTISTVDMLHEKNKQYHFDYI